jgi:light-regulated signal transduction histidine kinase (bacteriophytochrome)
MDRQRVESLQARVSELERQLEERSVQLKDAQQEITSLNYAVSHDLRSPLRNIFGFAHLLGKKYRDRLQGQGLEYLEMIMSGVERMGHMIDDLLNLSRIGRLDMKMEVVDLSAMAAEILEKLQESSPERQVQFHVAPGLRVLGDRQLLQAALTNLLDNAWKFTRDTQPAVISFGSRQEGDTTVYFVRDNGAGFAADQLYRLFNPFQRLHLETEFPGTGMGLAIVKKAIQRHGGKVLAEGAEGEGATFSFSLDGR